MLLRRRLLIAGGVCLLLVVGDIAVGSWVERRVGERLDCRLGVTDGAHVEVSGWPASLALVTGTVASVRVSATDAQLTDRLDGDLDVELRDVRRSGDGMSTGGGEADLTVPWPAVEQRLGRAGVRLSGADGAVIAEVETGLVPLALVAQPRVEDGRLALDPTGVRIGDRELLGALGQRLVDRLVDRVGDRAGRVLGEGVDLPAPSDLSLAAARATDAGLELDFDLAPGPLGAGLGAGRC